MTSWQFDQVWKFEELSRCKVVDGRYKVYLESESDLTLTLTLTLILTLTNYFQFQYTFIPAMDP